MEAFLDLADAQSLFGERFSVQHSRWDRPGKAFSYSLGVKRTTTLRVSH